jgi:diaminopimelate epimerase
MMGTVTPERAFKYHGLGNDFIVLDRRASGEDIDARTATALCDRRRGIGADGVLVLLPAREAEARMVVHNADGSTAEMCGNGLRCVVKHLVDRSGRRPQSVDVATGAGVLRCVVQYGPEGAREVQVAMGPARLLAENLPSHKSGRPFLDELIPGHDGLRGSAVSLGNPHLVLTDVPLEDAARLGPVLERHPDFPDRTNVEFVAREGPGLRVVVWERGAGLTQACGTGACAAVAASVKRGVLPPGEWVPVALPGGRLDVRVSPDLSSCELRGPATFVFEAFVALPPPGW